MVIVLYCQALAHDEGDHGSEEVRLAQGELFPGQAPPGQVGGEDHGRVRHHLGVRELHQPQEGVVEVALQILNQVLDVVVHTPEAIVGLPGAPNQTFQQRGEQAGRTVAHPVDHIRMPSEQRRGPIVVDIPIRADHQQVLDNGLRAAEGPALDGPHQGRDGLSAHRHVQQVPGPMLARGQGDGLLEGRLLVGDDGQHGNGGALLNDAHQNLRDQAQGPGERLHRLALSGPVCELLGGGHHKGRHQVRGDAVAHVAQAQRRELLHHVPGLREDFHHHLHIAVDDKVEPCGGLLEEILALGRHGEEAGVDAALELRHRVLIHALQEQPL
mmetsp:Transcript_12500/g.29547  ORF Transcript_12500/g.29547 Transcript_12500/m.29547 type:complete len:327 (+) Transcript_12500:1220-2200(+)